MPSLSVLVPARQEEWLAQTIAGIVANRRGDTEVIAVLDGAWADPPVVDAPGVQLVYLPVPVGQRAATNLAARLSSADYVMKLDAHCAVDEGFDVKLMQPYEDGELAPDVTTIPRMYNLHVFDWQCRCGARTYQGPKPETCATCHQPWRGERVVVWQPRWHRRTDFARFDSTLHFQYWHDYEKRRDTGAELADVMSSVGACWVMRRDRFWQLGGMDEDHGSWGQFGTEVACKAWLSGGRQVVNKRTWFSHLFRTQPGFGFPYPQNNSQVEHARTHSRRLWLENRWPGQTRPLSWLLDKFWPVLGWTDEARAAVTQAGETWQATRAPAVQTRQRTRGIVYYTDNRLDHTLAEIVREQITKVCQGWPIVSVSREPVKWRTNLVLPGERSRLQMFKQILLGLETIDTDVVFLCEHDVLYHASHFEFWPDRDDCYWYNRHWWRLDVATGRAVTYGADQVSMLCASRAVLLAHYRARVAKVEAEGYNHQSGYEPGAHHPPHGIDTVPIARWRSAGPNVDLRHGKNLTASRWSPEQFRDKRTCEGWTEADEIPGWGRTRGRVADWLQDVRG